MKSVVIQPQLAPLSRPEAHPLEPLCSTLRFADMNDFLILHFFLRSYADCLADLP